MRGAAMCRSADNLTAIDLARNHRTMLRRQKTYSKKGCLSCKQRKKKCDEGKPSCSACARIGLICSYDDIGRISRASRGAIALGSVDLPSAVYQIQAIQTDEVRDGTEHHVLQEIPNMLPLFWAPTASKGSQDLQVLRQMVAQHEMVRTAMVACFSEFLGGAENTATVKHRAFGRALQLLQAQLGNAKHDRQEGVQTKVAMNFIGMMQALNPDTDADLLEHWRGLTAFTLHWEQMGMHRWRLLPRKEYMLCQESLLFHVSILAMFSREPAYIHSIWKDSGASRTLEALNPEGPDRVSNSLLLSGQYILFELALEVTLRFRSPSDEGVLPGDLDKMMATVSLRQDVLGRDLGLLSGPEPGKRPEAALCRAYHLFCNALRICILALSEHSARQVEGVDALASESLHEFGRLRGHLEAGQSPHRAHTLWMALWPFQILACATRRSSDLELLASHFRLLGGFLDEGSRARTNALFDQIRRLNGSERSHEGDGREVNEYLPAGLSLLWKPRGVLA